MKAQSRLNSVRIYMFVLMDFLSTESERGGRDCLDVSQNVLSFLPGT